MYIFDFRPIEEHHFRLNANKYLFLSLLCVYRMALVDKKITNLCNVGWFAKLQLRSNAMCSKPINNHLKKENNNTHGPVSPLLCCGASKIFLLSRSFTVNNIAAIHVYTLGYS